METKVILMKDGSNCRFFDEAAALIQKGEVVAFPTETVYGLGADALNPGAVRKIFEAKGRPADNPLIVHIAEKEDVYNLAERVPEKAEALMEVFWPGPLTLVLPAKKSIPKVTTGGLDTVGIRMPAHEIARGLILASGLPIAAPSANTSGRPSPTAAAHVLEDMDGKIPLILDGGPAEVGLESTVLSCASEPFTLLRPGGVSREMIEAVIGSISVDPAVKRTLAADERPKAPGMKYKHYAPRAEVIVVEGAPENSAAYIQKKLLEEKDVGVMAFSEDAACFKGAKVITLGSRENLREVAANLFAALRAFDQTDVKRIYAQSVSAEGIGEAVLNRLHKAAGFHIVKV